jgi:hypothetical protein
MLLCSGQFLSRYTVQPITYEELSTDSVKDKLQAFDTKVNTVVNRVQNDIFITEDPENDLRILQDDDQDMEPYDPESTTSDFDDISDEAYDSFISAQALLPRGDEQEVAKVLKKRRDEHGNLVGTYNMNPLLDSRVYEFEFSDGATK